jgi:hypothetical protein
MADGKTPSPLDTPTAAIDDIFANVNTGGPEPAATTGPATAGPSNNRAVTESQKKETPQKESEETETNEGDDDDDDEDTTGSKPKGLHIVAAGIVIAALIAGGGFFFLQSSKNQDPNGKKQTTPSNEEQIENIPGGQPGKTPPKTAGETPPKSVAKTETIVIPNLPGETLGMEAACNNITKGTPKDITWLTNSALEPAILRSLREAKDKGAYILVVCGSNALHENLVAVGSSGIPLMQSQKNLSNDISVLFIDGAKIIDISKPELVWISVEPVVVKNLSQWYWFNHQKNTLLPVK